MAFGRIGSIGAGFGRLGSGAGAGGASVPVGPGADEPNGLGIVFAYPEAQRVVVKTAGVPAFSAVDSFMTTSGGVPKFVMDSTGLLVWAPHNLVLNSATPATQSVTGIVPGLTYTVSVTGTGSLTASGGATGVATAASPLTVKATTSSVTLTLAGSLTTMQMNLGPTATTYLATTAAKRYGIAIDYDATHGTHMLYEAGATNICLQSNDLTQAVWTKSTMTTAFTATGPNGIANNSTTLTATAGNATALQAITSTSQARITSVFLKSRLGIPSVDLTQDNGSTWTPTAITTSWARYSLPTVTSANPTVGIRLTLSNMQVDVALFQHEVGTFVSSPIPTFTTTVARAADNYTFLLSQIPALGAEYSLYGRFSTPNIANARYAYNLTDGTTNDITGFFGSTTIAGRVIDGGATLGSMTGPTMVANTLLSAAMRVKVNDCAMSVNGAAVVPDTTVATLPTVSEVRFGGFGSNSAAGATYRITKLVIVPRAWDNATLVIKSAA